jgi:hypothetical protein
LSSDSGSLSHLSFKLDNLSESNSILLSDESIFSDSNNDNIKNIYSENEIKNLLREKGVEIEWNGNKFIIKSFYVYKLTDIIDHLNNGILSKQIVADKKNGAIIRTINIENKISKKQIFFFFYIFFRLRSDRGKANNTFRKQL